MFKRSRIALTLGIAIAITIFISACSSASGSGGSTPTTSTTLGTPGTYNCVSGTLTVSGSTALQPLVTKVAADYKCIYYCFRWREQHWQGQC
jgi:ABC-type phosphate transport system substrate-binding protein